MATYAVKQLEISVKDSGESGGQVDYDDDGRLIYQLTILFEKEM
ncbi:hypothetical protein [Listeria seeligeri]